MPHFKSIGGKLIPYETWLQKDKKELEISKESPVKEVKKVVKKAVKKKSIFKKKA